MGFVNSTKFPPLGATLPLFKDNQSQGIIDGGKLPGNGMPVVCSKSTFDNSDIGIRNQSLANVIMYSFPSSCINL